MAFFVPRGDSDDFNHGTISGKVDVFINLLDNDKIIKSGDDELIAEAVRDFGMKVPRIPIDPRVEPGYNGTIVFKYPVGGDAHLVTARHFPSSLLPTQRFDGETIEFTYSTYNKTGPEIKAQHAQEIAPIRTVFARIETAVVEYNQALLTQLRTALAARRAIIKRQTDIIKEMGY